MHTPAAERDHLRFLVCGALEYGKSTLIDCLMVETGPVPDAPEARRGQDIDIADRYFSTPKRGFIVADITSREQYTRNLVTEASNADLALLLVDAKTGLTRQTLRHARILSLLGIRRLLLAVNKMDLVDFSEEPFAIIRDVFRSFASSLPFDPVETIPIVARDGDNIVRPSARMDWYKGRTVLQHLETVPVGMHRRNLPARFHVQSAVHLDGNARGYAGYFSAGTLHKGDRIVVARSGRQSAIARLHAHPSTRDTFGTGLTATIELADAIDAGRGDILAPADARPEIADQFAAHLVWLDEHPMLPGRTYSLKIGTQTVAAAVTALKYVTDIDSGEHMAAPALAVNEIGFCNLSTAEPIAFDVHADNREIGAFVLIDRETGAIAGAGRIDFALYRASNLVRQTYEIDKGFRAKMKGQRPAVVWFTGLPGAGKSTILNLVEQKLSRRGIHTYALDGDNLRLGLNRDLGFTEADRVENVRRAGEVARLMAEAGLIVLCAFVSPFRNERRSVRERQEDGEFIEVFVDTPLSVCEARDPKGLYAKARAGKASHVTGIDSPYEPPQHPELHLRTEAATPDQLADQVIAEMSRRGLIAR